MKMNKIILTVIGGGSVTWMPSLMQDIYLIDELDGGEIRLVDPDIESVHLIKEMLLTFNRLRNKSYDVSVVNDRQEALDGADFVLCTMSPGSLPAFYHDLEIPIKYGIRQPVSMTVGPSGISASLRTVPVAYELVEDMEKMCPDA
jgi:alpha-galactosidase/6-phospho-beta-glucosidase family protein